MASKFFKNSGKNLMRAVDAGSRYQMEPVALLDS
jgi:hypothetical protein